MNEASGGEVGIEIKTVTKPGSEDKWDHSYWDGTKWERWRRRTIHARRPRRRGEAPKSERARAIPN